MDEVYQRIENPEECGLQDDGESEIEKFYKGQTVFLTGSTGFMGKCVVEKLLRSCPDMKRLYLLVRPKKQWTVEQRMRRYFQNMIFDKLKEADPGFQEKVVALEGDLTTEGLGLSPEDRDTLVRETSIILHNAATVKFDERMSLALKINVVGTKTMLDLAKGCENLKVFMYVSTAYSNAYMREAEERFYPAPADMEVVLDMIAADESLDGMSEEAVKIALGDWPNTYTFTKAIAEGVIRENSEGARFPIGIFRPSIVISTYREPLRGWCGNLNGPGLGFVAAGLGLVHTAWATQDGIMDFIPVDMCANALLATSWDAATNRNEMQEPVIYNYGTSTMKPLSLIDMQSLLEQEGLNKPSIKMPYYYFMVMTNHYWVWFVLDKLTHLLPAVIVDLALLAQGKKTLALSAYLKITKYHEVIWHFCQGRWQFHTTETRKVWDRMNPVDSQVFFCDIRKFDWEDFGLTYWPGLRVYSIKDPMDTLDAGRSKFFKLKVLHYTVASCFAVLVLYLLRNVARLFVDIFW